MHLLLIFVTIVKMINAESEKLSEMQLGRIDVSAKKGVLSEKYQPLSPEDLLATDNIVKIIDQLKKKFSTGGANFPTIDPYKKDKIPPIDVGGKITAISGQLMLKNLVVNGAKELTMNSHEFRLKNYRYDFNFSIPIIYSEADFEAQLLVENLLPLSFDGHLRVVLKGINVAGAVNAKKKVYKNVPVFQLTSLHWKGRVEDPRVYLDYELINSVGIKANSVKEVVKNDVAAAVTNIVIKEANNALRSYSADTILKRILKP